VNMLDDILIDTKSHAYIDLLGQPKWSNFAPIFGSLTVVGATSYLGRFQIVGATLELQVRFSAATSVASVAGTDYLTLPKLAKGLAGFGVMTNDTTNVAVGLCHLDAVTSRLYLPAQAASASVFTLFAKYEV
jgi:hypothetical protein